MTIVKFSEIEYLLINAQGFDKQPLYTKQYAKDDFFVVYDNDVVLEKLSLDNYIGEKFIEGYIFKQNLEVKNQILATDTDYSPFLLVMGNVKCQGVLMAGNNFYIDGNLECNSIWGIYNHGSLTVKGSLSTQFLYTDEFNLEFGAINELAFIVGSEHAKYFVENIGMVLLTNSHSIDQVFNDYGQALCQNGLFEYLSSKEENLPPILNTSFDFYTDFPENVRVIFDKIFNDIAFENQGNIDVFDRKSNIFYTYVDSDEENSISIVNIDKKYNSVILQKKETKTIELTLVFYTDEGLEKVQTWFDLTENDQYYQAITVKHWFYKAEEKWSNKDIYKLEEKFDTYNLGNVFEELKKHFKNSIRFKNSIKIELEELEESEMKIGTSKMGGRPDLPKNIDWFNSFNSQKPMAFICQINFADIKALDLENKLPENGILYFFYDAVEMPWGFDPKDWEGKKVYYFDGNLDELERKSPPHDINEECLFSSAKMNFDKQLDVPDLSSDLIDIKLNDDDYDNYIALKEEFDGIHNKILGHSNNIQNGMELECELVTNGLYCGDSSGYKDPKRKELEKNVSNWELLLQIDSNEEQGMLWGDSGRLYLWITQENLKARKFEESWLVLQCF